VNEQKSNREVNMGRLRVGLTIAFFVCLGLTIASIFMDVGPSFVKCAAATVILHFVKESAVQMSEPKGS
jgi:Na+/H+ antiporter NhaD/arsenite permease-like protein